jgi:hypothetical protein
VISAVTKGPPCEPNLNMILLKRFAAANLNRRSALREVLLQEKDQIPAGEFLARLPVYLALLRREGNGFNHGSQY